mgnify:CR=1 FL=1
MARTTFVTETPVTLEGYQAVLKPSKFGYSMSAIIGQDILFGFLISYLLNITYWSVLICFFGGILAFYGDLLISFLKRDKSIKDTGNILPGHGGILDRIDSHLLATPIMLLFFILIVIL